MPSSKRVTQDDMRAVFRLLGDARDLRSDPVQQETVLINGLCGLIGASVGWASGFDGFRPNQQTRTTSFIPADCVDDQWLDTLAWWGQISSPKDDALLDWAIPRTRPADVVYSSESIPRQRVMEYPSYDALGVPLKITDSLAAYFRYPGKDAVRGYALQRLHGERDFTPRQAAVAQLFIEELLRLYHAGHLEPFPAYSRLPPRLQRLIPLFQTGMGQKQIADRLGLSYQTVRSYVKELYDILGVRSREELVAKLAGRRPTPASASAPSTP